VTPACPLSPSPRKETGQARRGRPRFTVSASPRGSSRHRFLDRRARHGLSSVRRQVPLVQLDWLDEQRADPVRLVSEALLERTPGVFFAQEGVDRLGVAKLDECIGAHGQSVMRSDRTVYCPNPPSPTASTMTSQGSAHGRFQRAIHRRQLFAAEMAARELDGLSLTDALDLTLLIREADRRRYERAAVRWLERFIQERSPALADVALAATALSQLDGVGDQSLRDLLRYRPKPSM